MPARRNEVTRGQCARRSGRKGTAGRNFVLPGRTHHEGGGRSSWGGRIASVADSLGCARALARPTGGIAAFPVENFRDTCGTGPFARRERIEKILTQEEIGALFRSTWQGKAKQKNISNFDIRT